jgi:ketosteroid isomerase-like protein
MNNEQKVDRGLPSLTDGNTHVVRRFFEEMSKKHNVDLDALNAHITNDQIYVQKYTPGHIDMFKLLEII